MGETTGTFDLPESAVRTRTPLRGMITTGLVAGAVLVYLSMTGIIERFHLRNLITNPDGEGVVQLSRMMLAIALLLAGWAVGSEKRRGARSPLLAGSLMGAVAGALLGVFVIIIKSLTAAELNVGEVLVSVSRNLVDTILFSEQPTVGFVILTVGGAVLGAVGAGLHTLSRRIRRPLVVAFLTTLLISMLEPILRPILANLGFETNWLYLRGGLTFLGAAMIFVGSGVVAWFWAGFDESTRQEVARVRTAPREARPTTTDETPTAETVIRWLGIAGLGLSVVLVGMTFGGTEFEGSMLMVALVISVAALVGAAILGRQAKVAEEPRSAALRTGLITGAAGMFVILPTIGGSFVSDVLGTVGLYVLLGLGLNIVVGYAGLLDLGYVAFFATGAYTISIFTSRASFLVVETGGGVTALNYADQGFTNFWLALPIAVVVSVIAGVLIGAPVLRLRGDYLAIVTLGFGEIIRTLVLSRWLEKWLGGAQGIIQIDAPPPEALDLRDPERLYYLIFIFVAIAAFVSYRLVNARVGRAWAAMREDESVAEAMGISVIKYKLLAFAMGAAVGSLGGAFFAGKIGSIFPNSFKLQVSINVLAVIVLGGMGSIPGVVIGSLVLVGLPELLREFAEYRLLLYGAILVAIMIYKPEGLLPNVRRRRELHEAEAEEEQYEEDVGAGGAEPSIVTTEKDEELD
jgi:ABC-type branched-subunit amino acid transport system permease subunit